MHRSLFVFLIPAAFLLVFTACKTSMPVAENAQYSGAGDTLIIQSLFADRSSTISEENIRKILEGDYRLPPAMRVAIVRLESPQRKMAWGFWNNEQYLKTQQSYLDLFSEKLKRSSRVSKLIVIPDLLISRSPSFTNIREAAVRMQADAVVVYTVTSDVYSRYKLFSKTDIKAFATTQLILLDVRTGLIPFSTIVTRDVLSRRDKEELDYAEAAGRIQHEAVLLTIEEIGEKIRNFLETK